MAEVVSTVVQVHLARPRGEAWQHLVLKRAASQRLFPNMWQCVTGRSNMGESAVQAAIREAHEESGLEAERLFVLPFVSHFYSERRDAVVAVPVFGIIVEENAQAQLSHEHEEFDWLDVNDAVKRCVIPAQRDAIQLFDQILKNSLQDSDFLRVYELNL